MTKRVQLVRHDNAGAQQFLGKEGECTVNTGNKSLHVHDGINQGGTELARADVVNVPVATAGNAGKMSAQQAADLAQALLDIAANAADISANYTELSTDKADKVVGATNGHLAGLDANGNLTDSGVDKATDILEAGTKAVFYQAAAPTGWTQDVTVNDQVLRVVSTAGGGNGGSWTISGISVDGHAITEAEMPSHNHSGTANSAGDHSHSVSSDDDAQPGNTTVLGGGGTTVAFSKNTSSSGAHTHSLSINSSGGGSAHSHGLTFGSSWRPAYIDVIVCTKNALGG